MSASPQTPVNLIPLPVSFTRADGSVAIEIFENTTTGLVKLRTWDTEGDLTLEINSDGQLLYSSIGSI